jgi:hypothetical protein
MNPQTIGLIAMGALIALVLLRVPIGVALGTVGFLGYAAVDGWRRALLAIGNTPYEMTEKYALTVVPLFVLMGVVAARAGMSRGSTARPTRCSAACAARWQWARSALAPASALSAARRSRPPRR